MSAFVRKSVGKETLAKPMHIWIRIINMYLAATKWELMDWVRLEYDTDK
jgi:hypothetical protein